MELKLLPPPLLDHVVAAVNNCVPHSVEGSSLYTVITNGGSAFIYSKKFPMPQADTGPYTEDYLK